MLGGCVAPRTAADHCGAASIATDQGCVARPPCDAGRARDLVTGECLPRRQVRALASSLGILVADDEILGCPSGGELATASGSGDGTARLACLGARPAASPALARACPAGAVAVAGETCARVFDGARVDVARWLHAVVGADGGEGAPPLCGALARSAGALGALADRPLHPWLTVTLSFPDNDVSLVVADARVGPPVVAGADTTVELHRAITPMIEALRSLGGTASQASIATAVRCAAASGKSAAVRPSPVPENDDEK